MKQKLAIFIFLMLTGFGSASQDPQFSQFYAFPMYLNPGFTGNTQQTRVSYIHRIQWPSIPGAFKSYGFAFDHNLVNINSGIGLMLVHDKAGSGGLRFTNIGGMYSYTIRLDRTHAIKPGIHLSYTLRNINFHDLVFGDQLIRGGNGYNTYEPPTDGVSYMDFSSGAIFYSTRYWVGIAFHHMNKPNTSLTGMETRLPMKGSVHAGYNIPLQVKVDRSIANSITITANYKAELKWDQFDLGAYYTHSPLIFGLWYRGIPLLKAYEPRYINHDALIAMVGYELKGLRIGYSYDVTISRLISNTAGSHEISLTYEFASKNQRKRNRRNFLVPCAKF